MRSVISNSPRIAVVYPILFGDQGIYGGGERYALELARALARKAPTRLVTFGERPRKYQDNDLEVCVYRPIGHPRGERLNPFSLRFLGALRGFDVIHCLTWNTLVTDFAILAGKVLGKKVFVTDVGGGASLTLQRRLALGDLVHRFLLIARAGDAQFERFSSRIRTIYAGIDTGIYKPDPATERSGVLFVGRLLPHKGVDYLIQAVDGNTPLRIVGRPYEDRYFQLLEELARGKQVTFITDASDEAVRRELQCCAVAVLPSVCTTVYGDRFELPELLGFTAMEAMASGAPTICTRVGGLPELMVDGVTGFLVPPNDPTVLGAKIRQILADGDLRTRLGTAARERIMRTFTWEQVASRCLEAYAS